METGLQIFTNEQFGSVRVVERDGEPWFIAKDVCELFDDTNHIRSVGRIDESDKLSVPIIDVLGRTQNATAVNESGLYSLLFSMQPQKANNGGVSDAYPIEVQKRINELRTFKRWITHDVLPSLRKHGMYAKDELLDNPDLLLEVVTKLKHERDAKNALAVINRCLEESNNRLEEQVAIMEPKADTYDALMESPTTFDIGAVAKIINVGVGRNKLFDILREQKILRKNRNPFQYYVDLGWFKCAETEYLDSYGVTRVGIKTVVYQKGIDGILKLLKEKYGLVPKIVA